jgi:hypothetical protein
MNDFDVELLTLVECYATENNLIDSEEALSDRFDEEALPHLLQAWHDNPQNYGQEFSDRVMLNEEFSNWTDGLCREHIVHPEQQQQYCYVGKMEYLWN